MGRLGLVLVLLYLVALLVVFSETAFSMVYTWGRLQTYNHGYLIAPISLWLIWERRAVLERMSAQGSLEALVLLAGCGVVWFLGSVVDALVVQQFGLVAMAIAGVWAILGTPLANIIFFPLMYLFFMVPVGDDLVPPLMEFTATFTVEAVRLSGIPVYREGMYFSLPSGNWNVISACSGIRYLIASVALGALFAYLSYSSWRKRAWFMVAAILVPIIANGFRAYSIVMIGHFSSMELAVGVDHLIWGWVFFGFVMFIQFSIGSIWRDEDALRSALEVQLTSITGHDAGIEKPVVIAGCAIFLVVILGFASYKVQSVPRVPFNPRIALPDRIGDWNAVATPWAWRPNSGGEDRFVLSTFSSSTDKISVILHQYVSQEQGDEVVRSGPFLVRIGDSTWRIVEKSKEPLILGSDRVKVNKSVLEGPHAQRLVIWWWYRVGDVHTSDTYYVKALEALSYMQFKSPMSSRIFIAHEAPGDDHDDGLAQRFLDHSLTTIESAMDRLQ